MAPQSSKMRYAQVGLGDRSLLYAEAIVNHYPETSLLVGICDSNPGRLQARAALGRQYGVEVPGYPADQEEPDYPAIPSPTEPIDPRPLKHSTALRAGKP
jgi:hypothetical protein